MGFGFAIQGPGFRDRPRVQVVGFLRCSAGFRVQVFLPLEVLGSGAELRGLAGRPFVGIALHTSVPIKLLELMRGLT